MTVAVKKVSTGTESNISDIFPKPLGRRRFEQLRRIIFNAA